MEKTQKYIASNKNSGFYVVVENNKQQAPFFCPICEFVLFTQKDFSYYDDYGCCWECGMKFVQKDVNAWNSGNRPTKDEISDHIIEMEMKTRDIFLLDEDT